MGLLSDEQMAVINRIVFHPDFVDTVSIAVAIVFVIIFHKRRKRNRPLEYAGFPSVTTGIDFLTGAGLFPLIALAMAFFSERLLHNLVKHDHIVFVIAGMFAFFAIIEVAKRETGPLTKGAAQAVRQ
ncbi:membrane hypothetical protein [Paraburkholderia tropica]|uniref:hypothetical protein n=1 Tax=Paraburkholderia tropica TaxID=92647 RepID=UPI001CB41A08|nr:hypothetical protein [Paraburkholderia tropica]CAG9235879.1 membrane hypothetical protein [Paraburkholderia tropica]